MIFQLQVRDRNIHHNERESAWSREKMLPITPHGTLITNGIVTDNDTNYPRTDVLLYATSTFSSRIVSSLLCLLTIISLRHSQ